MRGAGPIVIAATLIACGALEGSPSATTTTTTTDGGAPKPEAGSPDAGHLPPQNCDHPLLSDTFDRASTSDVQGSWSLAAQSTTTPSTIAIDLGDGAVTAPSLAVDMQSATDPGNFTGRGAYLRKTFSSAASNVTLRFAIRYGSFTADSDELTIAQLETGKNLNLLLAVKADGTIYAVEQLVDTTYHVFTAPVSLPAGEWTYVTLTFDATAKTSTLNVGGVIPPREPITLDHGNVSQLELGAVFAAYSGRARFSLDDVCVF